MVSRTSASRDRSSQSHHKASNRHKLSHRHYVRSAYRGVRRTQELAEMISIKDMESAFRYNTLSTLMNLYKSIDTHGSSMAVNALGQRICL